ncbi:MAG: haloacid dehalogenase [Pseudomonadota bacterium]
MGKPAKLTDFSALSFDCYGTLIDWETGILTALKPLTDAATAAGLDLTPDAILDAHGRHESAQQADTPALPYSSLLAIVYARLAGEWGLPCSNEAAAAYGASVPDWPAFPDSADALRRLGAHFHLIILSNVDKASFAGSAKRLLAPDPAAADSGANGQAAARAPLDQFSAVITAEDVGAYKPAMPHFTALQQTCDQLGVARERLLHVAESLFHDHVPATEVGLARCWIHRRHAQTGYGATRPPERMPDVDYRFTSMAEFADEIDRLAGGTLQPNAL